MSVPASVAKHLAKKVCRSTAEYMRGDAEEMIRDQASGRFRALNVVDHETFAPVKGRGARRQTRADCRGHALWHFEESPNMAFRNAAKIMKETGCGAVELEGGAIIRPRRSTSLSNAVSP